MNTKKTKKLPKGIGMIIGIVIGLAFGLAYGTFMLGSFIPTPQIGSVLGISMGIGIGIAIGAALEWRISGAKPSNKAIGIIIWLVALLFILEMASVFLIYYFMRS